MGETDKPVPFTAPRHTTLDSYRGNSPADIRSIAASAGQHVPPVPTDDDQPAVSRAKADAVAALAAHTGGHSAPVARLFARGDRAYHTRKKIRVTVMRPNVGRAADGCPMHEVVDIKGNKWNAKSSSLQ